MQEFVEETKKSSGLDEKVLSNQAGNESSPTFGTTDVKTGKGQEVAGKFLSISFSKCILKPMHIVKATCGCCITPSDCYNLKA